MPTSIKLTQRQQMVLDVVRSAIERFGAPPTRAEIAAALGFRSPNAAEEHLQALARKGAIELVGGTSRGIRLPVAASGNKRPMASAQQLMLPMAGLAQLTLPLVGRVAAGEPILAQEHIEQHYSVAPTLFTQAPDFLLRVKGDSMVGAGILEGDLLAVRKTSEARNGQIVVARLGDDVTVKRLQRQADRIELLAENPRYAPIVVRGGEEFAIEGLAVGLLRTAAW